MAANPRRCVTNSQIGIGGTLCGDNVAHERRRILEVQFMPDSFNRVHEIVKQFDHHFVRQALTYLYSLAQLTTY